MSQPQNKPERLIPALIAGAAGILTLIGLAMWQRQGLGIWLEQAIAFCF